MSTATTLEAYYGWDELLRLWQQLDVPEGWRAELSPEGVHMTPPPATPHNNTLARLNRQLVDASRSPLEVYPVQGIALHTVSSVVMPDLCVLDIGRVPSDDGPVDAGLLELVVEVTSPGNAKQDRDRKRWAYAHGGVPLYLLVDRFDEDGPAVTLFSEPSEGHYRRALRVPFGEPVTLPEPFSFELDTTGY